MSAEDGSLNTDAWAQKGAQKEAFEEVGSVRDFLWERTQHFCGRGEREGG